MFFLICYLDESCIMKMVSYNNYQESARVNFETKCTDLSTKYTISKKQLEKRKIEHGVMSNLISIVHFIYFIKLFEMFSWMNPYKIINYLSSSSTRYFLLIQT